MEKEKTIRKCDIKTIEKDNRFKPFCASCEADDYFVTETKNILIADKEGEETISYVALNAYCSNCNQLLFVPSIHEESSRRINEEIAKIQ